MNTFKIIAIVLIVLLAVDFAFCMLWAMSGQMPVDNFYLGVISHKLLQLIF